MRYRIGQSDDGAIDSSPQGAGPGRVDCETTMRHAAALLVLAAVAGSGVGAAAQPTTRLVVAVTHPAQAGEIGCALFASADGFPNEPEKGRGVRVPASGTSATCTFDDVVPGTYAVAVFLDTNGNRRSDRNFVGMPTEPWGVSNNVRPRMRAPRFDEATVTIGAGAGTTLEIRLEK